MFFEDIGFTYLGPIDGHDIPALIRAFETAKEETPAEPEVFAICYSDKSSTPASVYNAEGFSFTDSQKNAIRDIIFYVGESGNGRYKNICHVAMYYGPKQKKINGKYVNVGQIIHANSCVELSDYSGFRVNRVVLIVRAK